MVQKNVKDLARLARLARALEQNRGLWVQLQTRLESLSRTGVVVTGERAMLAELDGRLEKAMQALESLEQKEDPAGVSANLVELEQLLSDIEWEVAEQILADLIQKDEEQKKNIREYEDKIAEWQGQTKNLLEGLAQAKKARAPVIQEEREVLKLKALVDQAERTLRNQQFGLLAEPLAQLEAAKDKPQQLLGQMQGKVNNTQHFARQADLLLLRSPEVNQRYEYTVLLRTPSEPGSHGINIQDSSTLVAQDHEQLRATIERITDQVNAGLARQFNSRQASPSVAAGETSAAGAVAAMPDGTAESRNLITDRVRELQDAQNANDLAGDIGDLMYRLFMPEPMQRYLNDNACSITITTNDLELPWELMCSDNKFLCLERPVARLPMGRAFPRRMKVSRSGKKLRFFLIYADPQGNLPEAGKEIKQIKESLERDWKDQIEIDALEGEAAQGRKLNEALRGGKYDVIHYAGHAEFNRNQSDLSGLVLHQEEVFFAQKIRRLLEGRPLVFLNACDSGRTANEQQPQEVSSYLQKPAEGLASSFIYGGALGCIGALWPIYDQPAAEFAVEFYTNVLEGHMIGEAMRQARCQIRERIPQSNYLGGLRPLWRSYFSSGGLIQGSGALPVANGNKTDSPPGEARHPLTAAPNAYAAACGPVVFGTITF